MAEREKNNIPEFEHRAEEFRQRVLGLIEIFPNTQFEVVNLTKDNIESKKKVIRWYEANNFLEFASIEKDDLRELEIDAKRKNIIQINASESDHEKLESFIGEVDHLASKLAGEKLNSPVFRDWGKAKDGHERFVSVQSYSFNKSLFA